MFGPIIQPNFWVQLALMMGHPELVEDRVLAGSAGRMEHQDEIEERIVQALAAWPKERIFREGQETWRVTVGYLASLQELLEDPHLAQRGYWRPLGNGSGDREGSPLRTAGSPFRFVGEDPPAEPNVSPPGSHIEEALDPLEGEETADLPVRGASHLDRGKVFASSTSRACGRAHSPRGCSETRGRK